MFILEQALSEAEALMFITEGVTNSNILKTDIAEPMYEKLSSPQIRKQYISLGEEFLTANAIMLAKEYPTTAVSFPRRYVDNVIQLFGFTQAGLKKTIKEALKEVDAEKEFLHIMASPTNVLHIIIMCYSDMVENRLLRDSAKQQLALTNYARMYQKYFPSNMNEALMAYTYSQLKQTWNIVRDENMINWIGGMVETVYEHHHSKIVLELNMKTVVIVLNGIRNNFNQSMCLLANKYHEFKNEGVLVGDDLQGDEDYVDTNSYTGLRNSLLALIKNGDKLYSDMGDLYKGIGRLKNVDAGVLYEFATKKIKHSDIATLMDLIFYVFLVKEGHKVSEINRTQYINRITNFPTQVDRCIQGRPVIEPMSKKYKTDQDIIRAYICLIATYILNRINDVNQSQ